MLELDLSTLEARLASERADPQGLENSHFMSRSRRIKLEPRVSMLAARPLLVLTTLATTWAVGWLAASSLASPGLH